MLARYNNIYILIEIILHWLEIRKEVLISRLEMYLNYS